MKLLDAPPLKTLRGYQDTICQVVLEHLEEQAQDIVLGMPPGSGKTSTLQFLMASHLEMNKRFTVLLVEHRSLVSVHPESENEV